MWQYNYSISSDELYHFGIMGMKWGHRKDNYQSTGLKSAIARRQNKKVDKSFNKWKENSNKRENAIELGKKANASRMAYENNKSDKSLRNAYKQDNKAYKKALKGNTTYRKGQVRKEVGQDSSRKYLSEAKKIKKQLDADPSNKELSKQYNKLMSKHDVERAKARRATSVAENRSTLKASVKRTMSITLKSTAVAAAVLGGTIAVNRYFKNHNTTLNGRPLRISDGVIRGAANTIGKILGLRRFVY